jgi:tetratricopeptide (TPR) repeat protein
MVTDAGAPALEFLPKAAIAAQRALDCDWDDAEAHATMGQVAAMLDYDWIAARLHFRRARDLSPSTHVRMAYVMWHLIPQGRTDEALAECDELINQDPLLLIGRSVQASALLFARLYDEGVACCLRVLDIDPDFSKALQLLSNARTFQGHYREGIYIAEHLVKVLGRSYVGLCNLGIAQAAAGDKEGAHRTLDEILHKLPNAGRGAPAVIGCIYALLGDKKSALIWIQRAWTCVIRECCG